MIVYIKLQNTIFVPVNVLAMLVSWLNNHINVLSIDASLWPDEVKSKMVTSTTGITKISDCAPYQNYAKAEGLDYDTTISSLE